MKIYSNIIIHGKKYNRMQLKVQPINQFNFTFWQYLYCTHYITKGDQEQYNYAKNVAF